MTAAWVGPLVEASYFAAALLFILGIKRMASPVTARSGIQWAGAGMLLATVATFFYRGADGVAIHNLGLIALALVLGTAAAWVSGKRVAITDMPQMVALFNGMGGGSATAKNARMKGCDNVTMAAMPKPIAATNTMALNACWPGKV